MAIYIPFRVFEETTFKRILFVPSVATGNVDIGIYDAFGTKIITTGSFAKPAGITATVIADTVLTPGLYYMALAHDGTSSFIAYAIGAGLAGKNFWFGIRKQAAAFPLPATAAFADSTDDYIPLIGIAAF
jgi:hypothetical protein